MGVDVTGGPGGVGAALEDLTAAAARLGETSGRVADVTGALLRAGAAPELVTATPAAPVEVARVVGELAALTGLTGLPADSAALLALAVGVRSAVTAYAAAEQAAALLVESAQDTVVLALSRQPAGLVGAAVVAQGAGLDVAEVVDRVGFAAPWLADLAGGVEGLVAGPLTPADYEDGLGLLVAAGSSRGWLTEAGRGLRVDAVGASATGPPPRGLADLVATQAELDNPGSGPDRVRVLQVPQRDGSSTWVAVIPGTQAWSPRAGANPFDLTSDVLLLAQRQTLLAAGVERALTLAQRDAGRAGRSDPVMLAGHSQGGIVAAALAADDGFRARHRVTHVVTTGAPVARLALPPTVSVLSLEHTQDVVPRLEGRPNADRRSHVTVTRDLRGDPVVAGRAAAAHSTAAYIATAEQADRAGSASLSAWREGAAAFLGDGSSSAQVRDYRVWREEGVAR
ncbi:MAG TPA: hypothetical protein VIB11_01890 [Pedococcus sp.]|jgi:hypothetical protein|uniref:PGAP1-like alpha/beta domain-containing protein n=1 Tax=Pedococcus sp. TaxID=2860345 RepID=UPI002F92317C